MQERRSFEREYVYLSLYERNPEAIFFLDLEGRVLDANPAGERLLGVVTGDPLSGAFEDLAAPDCAESMSRCFELSSQGETASRDTAVIPRDGERREITLWTTPVVEDGEVIGVCAALADNTERRRMENDRALLAAIADSTDDAILGKDLDGVVTSWNRGAEALYGYSREEVLGRHVSLLMPEDRRHEAEEILRRIREGGSVRGMETVRRAKEGHLVPVSITVSPIRGEGGQVVGASTIAHDITPVKEAEKEARLATQRLETRNKELQDFAYVASHDLQEPLRKIQAFGGRLRDRAGDALDARSVDYLGRMLDASSRMQELITDLLTFSRITTKARPAEPVDLSRLVESVVADLETRVEETGGEVRVEELPEVRVEPAQMRQLFQNLIGNALKFHREGTPPAVAVGARLLNGEGMDNDGTPGREVYEFRVGDNGVGFDEKYLDRIFTPFQRLHGRGEYEGTGIGLAVCRKVVERHGGEITAESTPGEGTTFIFTLPAEQENEDLGEES